MRVAAAVLLLGILGWLLWPDARDRRVATERELVGQHERQERTAMSPGDTPSPTPAPKKSPSVRSRSEDDLTTARLYISPEARHRACAVTMEIESRAPPRVAKWLDERCGPARLRWERRGDELRILLREEAWEEAVERGYDAAALPPSLNGIPWRDLALAPDVQQADLEALSLVLAVFGARSVVRRQGNLVLIKTLPAIHREIARRVSWAKQRGPTLAAARDALRAGDRVRAARLAREVLALDAGDFAAQAALLRASPPPEPTAPAKKTGEVAKTVVRIYPLKDLASRYDLGDGHDIMADIRTVAEGLGPGQVQANNGTLIVAAPAATQTLIRKHLERSRCE